MEIFSDFEKILLPLTKWSVKLKGRKPLDFFAKGFPAQRRVNRGLGVFNTRGFEMSKENFSYLDTYWKQLRFF